MYLVGSVRDENGSAVSNASVAVKRDRDGLLLATVTTDTLGRFLYQQEGSPGAVTWSVTVNGRTENRASVLVGPASGLEMGELSRALRGFTNGVVSGVDGGLAVTAPGTGMTVTVSTGSAVMAGIIFTRYASGSRTIAAANATNPRIDLVLVRAVRTGSDAGLTEVVVRAGTPAATPVAPALVNDANTAEVALAEVRVDAGVGSIASGKTTDRRIYLTTVPADGSVTTAKLTDNSVTSAKIVDGTIAAVDLADSSVTSNKIANDSVTSNKIANGTIATADLADSSVTRAKQGGGWPRPRWLGGIAYFPDGLQGATDTVTMFANQLRGVRILPSQAWTVQGVIFEVLTGVTGNVRVGIYSEHSTGPQPYQLLWDGGAVSTSTAAIKNVTGAALSRGEEDPYWLVLLPSVNVSVRGVVNGKTAAGPGLGSSLTSPESTVLSINISQTYGTLPATLGAPIYSVTGLMLGALS